MSVRNNIIKGLMDALTDVKTDASYPIELKYVSEYDENFLYFDDYKIPAVMIVDTGEEELKVRNGQNYKYAVTLDVIGYIKTSSRASLRKKLNDVHSFIKQFIDSTSGTTIHSRCQALEYLSGENHWFAPDDDIEQGGVSGVVVINAIMRYNILSGSF